jgi:hypothetical protein
MRITSINYSEHEGVDKEWRLNNLELDKINLIVGKNATGKSRCVNVIAALAQSLLARRPLNEGCFKAIFDNGGGKQIIYTLTIKNTVVEYESMTAPGESKLLLERDQTGSGSIFYSKEDRNITFQIPTNMLAAVIKQDKVQHPFLTPLHDWAEGVFLYHFGSQMGQNNLGIKFDGVEIPVDVHNDQLTIAILRDGLNKFGESFKAAIIEDMGSIGYIITDISTGPPQTVDARLLAGQGFVVPSEPLCVRVNESDLPGVTDQFAMSQGMFRALATFINLNYGMKSDNASLVMIDDIGEGLDFDRSIAVIKRVMQHASGANIQLVMTTNDRFVMNNVALNYWSVLERHGPIVNVHNYQNAKKKFDEFKFTGLNNFDFFSSEFLKSKES